jgi:hypothetical protein
MPTARTAKEINQESDHGMGNRRKSNRTAATPTGAIITRIVWRRLTQRRILLLQ